MSDLDTSTGAPFEKLSIFYPMWNEEEYVERALSAGRRACERLKTGFATATGDLILYTDADLPFDMAELPRAVRLMRDYDADIISAYRFDRTGEGYLRSVYTFVYNLLIRTLFDVKARDINFAFKLCRARVFDHVELHSEGSFIDAELVIRSTRLGYEMLQFGVDYFPRTRGESTLSTPGVIVTIIKEMWGLRGDLEGIEPIVRTE